MLDSVPSMILQTSDKIAMVGVIVAAIALVVATFNFAYFVADYRKRFLPRFQILLERRNQDTALGDFGFRGTLKNRGFAADVTQIRLKDQMNKKYLTPVIVWEGLKEAGINNSINFDIDTFEVRRRYVFWIDYNGHNHAICFIELDEGNNVAVSTVS
jgi:hypothetical protein